MLHSDLVGPQDNSQNIRPFPGFGGSQFDAYEGVGSYNSGQVTLEKRNANGLYFLATYTYGHALDDTATPLDGGAGIYRSPLILPIGYEYTNSDWDVRHRVTLNGSYQLPFGRGREFLNRGGVVNEVAGGWAADLVFVAQTGNPFTVNPNITQRTAPTQRALAVLLRDPYASGGSPDPSNAGTHMREQDPRTSPTGLIHAPLAIRCRPATFPTRRLRPIRSGSHSPR